MAGSIVDGEQCRERPESPCAFGVPAARGHLPGRLSSTTGSNITCVAPPGIYPQNVRNGIPPHSRAGSSPRIPRYCKWLMDGVLIQSHPIR